MTNMEVYFPPHALAMYEVAIDEEARLAVRSFLAYGRAISENALAAECAGYLHDALTHCAALSRYFWPSRSAGDFGDLRGELLQKRYSVDKTSPLADRSLRNALEHFDERIDAWVLGDPVGPIVASPIIAEHTIGDDGFGHAFKVIDPEMDMYVLLGRKFSFSELSQEVARIVELEGR